MKLVRTALLLLLAVSSLAAAEQPLRFGSPFPLPNTSYGSAYGAPKLVAAGEELYAFWATQTDVRMTRIAREQRAGIPLITIVPPATQLTPNAWPANPPPFDAVWNGSHFLVAAQQPGRVIVTQLFNLAGEPVSPRLAVMGDAWAPKLAINGESVLLAENGGRLMVLTNEGQVVGDGESLGFGIAALVPYGSGFAVAVNGAYAAVYAKTLDAAGRVESTTLIAEGYAGGLAVNDEGLLVCVRDQYGPNVRARFIHRDGTAEPLLILATAAETYPGFGLPEAVWSGSEWIVTYNEVKTTTLHITALDARASRVTRSVARPGSRMTGVPFRFADRTYVSWYPDQQAPLPAPLFAEVSTALGAAEEWTFKAGEQHLLATAASDDATLVVWKEEIDGEYRVRTGVRSRSGEWSESTLATPGLAESDAITASNGQHFLVVLTSRNGYSRGARVFRLDGRGRASGGELRLEPQVTGATWNGRQWVLVTAQGGKLTTIFVPPNGTSIDVKTVALTDVDYAPHHLSVAYDGTGYAVVWAAGADCWILPCRGAQAVRMTRLTADFQRRDAADFTLGSDPELLANLGVPSLVWTGSEYVAAWTAPEGIEAAALPRSGGAPSRFTRLADTSLLEDGLRVVGKELAILGMRRWAASTVILVDRARGTTRTRTFDHTATALRGWPRIEVLPDDRLAYFVSRISPFAPQHGATHVMMSIQEPVAIPGPPALTVRPGNGSAQLTWSAAAGVVNGYRVEYRLNDGSWNELTQWFDANERTHVFRLPATATAALFRVRAFSDGGAGPYSDEVAPTEEPPAPPSGKRRSVR